MLVLSWLVARTLIAWLRVSAAPDARLAMGGVGLALLVAAEMVLGFALGQSPAGQIAAYATWRGVFTALGQAGFLIVPLLVPAPPASEALRSDRVGT